MLIYIHFPFCKSKCSYCGFFSYVFQKEYVKEYLDALYREIKFWGEKLPEIQISTVYFGGGTPSLLDIRELEDILSALKRYFSFSDPMEITLEANPESVDEGYLRSVLVLGINRLSLGVQSLDDQDLVLLKRRHGSNDALNACLQARTAGFENLNADLIWGLPEQSVQKWLEQLSLIIQYGITHLSCYNLTLEPDTELEKWVQNREVQLPEENEQGKMFIYGAQYLEEQGFLHYEISNFSKMGFVCRHNLGYWENRDYIGMGPSATSTFKGLRIVQPRSVQEYATRVNQGNLLEGAEKLGFEQKRKEFLMLRLRTVKGMNLKEYRRFTGKDFCKEHSSMLEALRQNELIRLRKGYLSLTKFGMLVSDSILSHLI